MKEVYETVEMVVLSFEAEDIICSSPPTDDTNPDLF